MLLTLTNAKSTDGGSSESVASDSLSGVVLTALIFPLEKLRRLKGLRLLRELVMQLELKDNEVGCKVPIFGYFRDRKVG